MKKAAMETILTAYVKIILKKIRQSQIMDQPIARKELFPVTLEHITEWMELVFPPIITVKS